MNHTLLRRLSSAGAADLNDADLLGLLLSDSRNGHGEALARGLLDSFGSPRGLVGRRGRDRAPLRSTGKVATTSWPCSTRAAWTTPWTGSSR